MKIALRKTIAAASLAATFGALGFVLPAAAQSDAHQHEQGDQRSPGMGGMMGMMQGCPMMQGGGMAMGGGHGMPHLPPGNEKLEVQMHADMMKAMADVLAKYAARLPDRK
jgi:hypothetical protein